jgi:hypothetical protein
LVLEVLDFAISGLKINELELKYWLQHSVKSITHKPEILAPNLCQSKNN